MRARKTKSEDSDTPETYYQFPLCLLSIGSSQEERWGVILAYSIVAYGLKLRDREDITCDVSHLEVEERLEQNGITIEAATPEQEAWAYGVLALSWKNRSMDADIQRYKLALSHREHFVVSYTTTINQARRPGWEVRLRSDIVEDAYLKRHTSRADRLRPADLRDLSIIAAVYTVCNTGHPAEMKKQVLYRYLGYWDEYIFLKEIDRRQDGLVGPMGYSSLVNRINSLENMGYFTSITPNRRTRIFSNNQHPDEHFNAITDREAERRARRQSRTSEEVEASIARKTEQRRTSLQDGTQKRLRDSKPDRKSSKGTGSSGNSPSWEEMHEYLATNCGFDISAPDAFTLIKRLQASLSEQGTCEGTSWQATLDKFVHEHVESLPF